MPSKKHKPEEIIGKLREVEIVLGQGGTTAEACRRIAVGEQTYYRWAQGIWWPEDGPGASDEGSGKGKRPAAACNFGSDAGQAHPAGGGKGKTSEPRTALCAASTRSGRCWTCPSGACAVCLASTGQRSAKCHAGQMMSRRSPTTSWRWQSSTGATVTVG